MGQLISNQLAFPRTKPPHIVLPMFLTALIPLALGRFTVAMNSHLTTRSAQTTAVCDPSFSWADNSQNASPCLLAADVLGACAGGSWVVPSVNSTFHYAVPDQSTANSCTCSWLAYNLLSACTSCQGFDISIQNWTPYILDCGSFAINSFFPSNIALPTGLLIPFWATTDPTTWPSQRFDSVQAKVIADEGKPEVQQTEKTKTSHTGAIAGGVVGGVAVLAVAAAIAAFMLRRQRITKHRVAQANNSRPIMDHRPLSDISVGSPYAKMQSMTAMGMTPFPGSPSSLPEASVNSLSYYNSGGGTSMPFSSPHSGAITYMSPTPSTLPNREDVIVPFDLGSPSPTREDRAGKEHDGVVVPIYDSPNARPQLNTEIVTPSRRLNPPAYSPFTPQAASSPRSEKVASGGSSQWNPSHTSHGGSIDEALSQSGGRSTPVIPQTSSDSGGRVIPARNEDMDRKRRPTVTNPGDIA